MKQVAFMFPGQGSQVIGMGKDFFDAYDEVKQLFAMANEVLHKDIQQIMFEGPMEVLTETENAQPALLLTSVSINRMLEKEGIRPAMTVGHSLGEYSALVASGALSADEALPLVQTRGRLMEAAFPKGQGTMAAVLGLQEEVIQSVLDTIKDEIVDIANLNCPGQIVISGSKEGIEQASEQLKAAGAKRVIPLNVSGPFHSRLMKKANEEFANYLDKVNVQDAAIPVYANVSARPVTKKEEIKNLLIQQLYSPVRFEESIRQMIDKGVDAFVEVGSGKVLSGLLRKIDRKATVFAVHDIASMENFIRWYKEEA
ncbi:malonyl CoA-acyl carrier protein transacylase [Compostibacillus humi]|uniref:Malonyl CoA-acyl carrier protein transacylase n=1 Tax=Compostibacillus humi TaxID=1245525 RepID=A0A8J3EJ43_9BACI|nr:ACP S-malonyltransferase [Compostibacillus humi]GGH69341.1 malonyl CoA-acyl carrier protein transacylase [Compostibacillus humi]